VPIGLDQCHLLSLAQRGRPLLANRQGDRHRPDQVVLQVHAGDHPLVVGLAEEAGKRAKGADGDHLQVRDGSGRKGHAGQAAGAFEAASRAAPRRMRSTKMPPWGRIPGTSRSIVITFQPHIDEISERIVMQESVPVKPALGRQEAGGKSRRQGAGGRRQGAGGRRQGAGGRRQGAGKTRGRGPHSVCAATTTSFHNPCIRGRSVSGTSPLPPTLAPSTTGPGPLSGSHESRFTCRAACSAGPLLLRPASCLLSPASCFSHLAITRQM